MSDNGISIILVFVQEIVSARECNLVDVFLYFVGSHTYTTVGNSNGLGILINTDSNFQVTQFAFEFTFAAQCL